MKNNCFHQTSYGEETINVRCPASIVLKNDSSIYFDTKNGFSLGPGKHKNAFTRVFCTRPTKNRGGPRCMTYFFWGGPGMCDKV